MNVRTPSNQINVTRSDTQLILRGRNLTKFKKEFPEIAYRHLRRKGGALYLLFERADFIEPYRMLRAMGYTFSFTYEQYPEFLFGKLYRF